MFNGRLVQYDLQAESFGWLFMSLLVGGGDILCRPHYTHTAAQLDSFNFLSQLLLVN